MLVIRRKVGQSVDFNGPAEVTVLGTSRGEVRLGIVVDEAVTVERLNQMVPQDLRDMIRAYIAQQHNDTGRAVAVDRVTAWLREAADYRALEATK